MTISVGNRVTQRYFLFVPSRAINSSAMRVSASITVLIATAAILPSAGAQVLVPPRTADSAPAHRVVHFHATKENVKTLFGPAEPVAALRPGDILETTTLDCFGGALQNPGDKLSQVTMDNPLTGPFYIEGAQPGDTLVIKFLELTVDGNQGIGVYGPGFGALTSSTYTPMLASELPERIWFYPIDRTANTATFKPADSNFNVKIPLHPFLGCVGSAPANGEARSSIVPAEFGGNLDSPEASAGNTLYLPVNVRGALLYLGDGHAAMGAVPTISPWSGVRHYALQLPAEPRRP